MRGVWGTAGVLALLIAGCGGGGGEKASTTPTTATGAETTASTTATTAPPAETSDATGLKRYEVMGVSALLPANWKGKPDDTSVILGPEDDKGAAGLIIFEDGRTADEWIDRIFLSGFPKGTRTLERKHVRVPSLGRGVRLTLRRPKSPPDHYLFVSTIDGLIVEVTASPGPHLTAAQSARILASPRRVVG